MAWREDTVPLSEEELRLLEQMERALVAEDPKLRVDDARHHVARRRPTSCPASPAVVFVVGVVVLMTGAVTQITVVGIVGFVVMLGLGVRRPQLLARPEQAAASRPPRRDPAHPRFSVIDGGRTQGAPRPAQPSPPSQGSMMERFEERWRRRRDQNGY